MSCRGLAGLGHLDRLAICFGKRAGGEKSGVLSAQKMEMFGTGAILDVHHRNVVTNSACRRMGFREIRSL